jgi:hypothetical protein
MATDSISNSAIYWEKFVKIMSLILNYQIFISALKFYRVDTYTKKIIDARSVSLEP